MRVPRYEQNAVKVLVPVLKLPGVFVSLNVTVCIQIFLLVLKGSILYGFEPIVSDFTIVGPQTKASALGR